jgi:pyruvate ferredoxin oxidoreductase alpha subunit
MGEQKIDFITGNEAVAYAVKAARVQVVVAYPITPQSPVTEKLSEYVANGELGASFVEIEGEHSCFAAVGSASGTGCRVFTATCGPGLAYGHENVQRMHISRFPVVIAVPNRALGTTIFCDHSDTMAEATCGWIQLYTENAQEVLDTVIQAFKVAEDHRVLMPVMVCYDGYVTSHTGETIRLPAQEDVDSFLPPRKALYTTDPSQPLVTEAMNIPVAEWEHEQAMQSAKAVIREANEEYAKIFGRIYGNGLTERFMCEGAEAVLVTMSSATGTAREVVAEMRGQGHRIGLLKLKSFRPFPIEDFRQLAGEVKAVGVLERNETHGSGCGEAFKEVRSAMYDASVKPKTINFIGGLGGSDVRIHDVRFACEKTLEAARTGRVEKEVHWLVPELMPAERERTGAG